MVGKRVFWGLSVLFLLCLFGNCNLGTDIETIRERLQEQKEKPGESVVNGTWAGMDGEKIVFSNSNFTISTGNHEMAKGTYYQWKQDYNYLYSHQRECV